MASDANLVLQTRTSQSATLSSTALSIGDVPRRGMKARITYFNTPAAHSGVATWSLQASYDAGSTYFPVGAQQQAGVSTSATNQGEVHIPFEVSRTVLSNPVLIQLVTTIASPSGASSASVVFQADVVAGRPG